MEMKIDKHLRQFVPIAAVTVIFLLNQEATDQFIAEIVSKTTHKKTDLKDLKIEDVAETEEIQEADQETG